MENGEPLTLGRTVIRRGKSFIASFSHARPICECPMSAFHENNVFIFYIFIVCFDIQTCSCLRLTCAYILNQTSPLIQLKMNLMRIWIIVSARPLSTIKENK